MFSKQQRSGYVGGVDRSCGYSKKDEFTSTTGSILANITPARWLYADNLDEDFLQMHSAKDIVVIAWKITCVPLSNDRKIPHGSVTALLKMKMKISSLSIHQIGRSHMEGSLRHRSWGFLHIDSATKDICRVPLSNGRRSRIEGSLRHCIPFSWETTMSDFLEGSKIREGGLFAEQI